MKRSTLYVTYVSVLIVLLILPLICMGFARTDTTTENRELASWPQLMVDGAPNVNYLKQAGDYFNDHFAFRNQMVALNSTIRSKVVGASGMSQVIVGSDGWLYFDQTLDDYLGRNQLSAQGARNAAYNVSLMQEYVQSRGSQFVFTVAPNKNSLYPDNMPYYYLRRNTASNIENLKPLLEEYAVNYVDLYDALNRQNEVLYYRQDTHWNDGGAAAAYSELMESCAINPLDLISSSGRYYESHVGDLESMAYPVWAQSESAPVYDLTMDYRFLTDATDVTDDWLVTGNSEGQGSLLMFRDSFGNALLPYMASTFERVFYSKLIPYSFANVDKFNPDVVIVERAERHLAFFAQTPPVMEGPAIDTPDAIERQSATTIEIANDGDYIVISGLLDSAVIDERYEVIVEVRNEADMSSIAYRAFRTSVETGDKVNDNGYLLRLKKSSIQNGNLSVGVVVSNGEENAIVAAQNIG